MPLFPSLEWCQEVVRLAHDDPESEEAGVGWKGDLAVVFLPEPTLLPNGFAVHVRTEGGHLTDVRPIEPIEQAEALGTAYLAKAAYSVWKGLLTGTLDPVEAVLLRQITLAGDLGPVVARVGHKGWIERTFARVRTEFLDEP